MTQWRLFCGGCSLFLRRDIRLRCEFEQSRIRQQPALPFGAPAVAYSLGETQTDEVTLPFLNSREAC
jgi:hypothetical protein